MIEIGFSRPKKFKLFSVLTRLWQGWTPYSHVYLKFRIEDIKRVLVLEASYGEVHFIEYSNWQKANICIAKKSLDFGDWTINKALVFGIDRLQKPYGITSIVGIFLNELFGVKIFTDGDKSYICSELVANALGDYYKFNKPLDYVTPKDLYNKIFTSEAS